MIRYFLAAAFVILLAWSATARAVPYTTMSQTGSPSTPVVNMPAPEQPSGGGTPISDEEVKAYYDRCVSRPTPPLTAESQAAFCSCTAQKMQQSISAEEQKVLAQNDQQGRNMLNKVLIGVYAPCMDVPVQAMLEKQCLLDMQGKPLPPGMNMAQICRCMSSKTGQWLSANGGELMSQVLAANPNITDPMGPVMDDASFKNASSQNLTSCLSGGGAQ